MPILSYDLSRFAIGVNDWSRGARARIESNADDGWKAEGRIVLPDALAPVANDGTGSIELEPTPEGIKYQFVLRYHQPGANTSEAYWRSGWFSLTEDADLYDLATVDVKPIPEAPVVAQLLEARDEAQAAAAQTEADRIAVEAVGTTNDTIIAGRIEDPESATAAALRDQMATEIPTIGDLRYQPLGVRIDALPAPFVIGHRGGGANIAPDGTLSGMRLAVDLGIDAIEIDTVLLRDGGLGVMHDWTTDRTTDRAGQAADFSTMTWRTLTVKPANFGFPGYPDEPAPLLGDVIAQIGGKAVLMPEIKTQGGTAEQVRMAEMCHRAITAAGLNESTIVQTFYWPAAVRAAELGMHVAWFDPAPAGTTRVPSELVTAGIEYVGVDLTATSATIAAFKAAGVKVISYIADAQTTVAELTALGVDGIFSDDPLYAQGRVDQYRRTSAPWTTNPSGQASFYHGHLVAGGKGEFIWDSGSSTYRWKPGGQIPVLMGWACPLPDPTTYTITVPITLDAAGGDATRWAGVYFAATADTRQSAVGDLSAGIDYYLAALRQNGTLQLWKRTGGTTTSLGTAATPALTAGTTATLRIDVTPTDVTVTRTDASEPNTVTATDAWVRGPYFYARDSGQGATGRSVSFGNITIT